jgi:ATP-dependent DNA ligase
MLARLEFVLPRGAHWVYEPKLDGFRGQPLLSDTNVVRLLGRNLEDLSLSFLCSQSSTLASKPVKSR